MLSLPLVCLLSTTTAVAGFHRRLSVYPHDISKTVAATITKRDTEMFHDESWKPIHLRVKRSKVVDKSHKKCRRESLHFCGCWLFPVCYAWIGIKFQLWTRYEPVKS